MAYIGNARFNLAYMHHTGSWNKIYHNISIEEFFKAIRDEPHFLALGNECHGY
jgi:hypothetical protein